MAITRIVKVQRPMVSVDGAWRGVDQRGEYEDEFQPTEWMRECMGGRMQSFFVATWSADGWIFKRRVKEPQHW